MQPAPRAAPLNTLIESEREVVLALLCRDEHVDQAIAQVCAETLDESTYLCSQSHDAADPAGEYRH
jgi:hypothetical protein